MSTVKADMSISLDGFITGPDDGVEQGLGAGGERLHEWLYDLATFHRRHGREGGRTGPDDDVLAEAFEGVGAYVMGRRMFDVGEAPWGEDPPFKGPVFVVTHRAKEKVVKHGGTTFTFVTELHVAPMLLGAGRRLFGVPGTDPIELEATRVIDSPAVTHLRYRVLR